MHLEVSSNITQLIMQNVTNLLFKNKTLIKINKIAFYVTENNFSARFINRILVARLPPK